MERGPQAESVVEALAAAREQAAALDAGPALFQATWGLYLHEASNLRLDAARAHGDELTRISERLGDEDLHVEALHHRWGIAYFNGEVARLLEHAAAGLARYDTRRHHRFAHVFAGHDLGVCAHGVSGIGAAMCGWAERTHASVDAGVSLAEALEHPVSLAFSLGNAATASCIVGDPARSARHAERLLQVSSRYDLAGQRAFAAFLLALASAEEAGASVTADALERHYAGARTQGFVGVFPVAALAEALRRAGREADALALLDGVLDALPHPRRGAFVPELWRCRGEIRARIDPAAAEHDLRVALAIASAQETALYRLRASTALARVLLETGRRAEAAAVLAQAEGANGCDAGHRERGALAELQRAATQRRSATSLP